jgi:dihydropteroate synthase
LTKKTLKIRGRLLDLTTPQIMGILNVTPDSFFDGGKYSNDAMILKRVEKMLLEGAAFIDVGAYSSRPGAQDVPLEEERAKAVNSIRVIVKEFPDANISIDTFRSEVAAAAIGEGAAMVNDISAGDADKKMLPLIASAKVAFVAMHMRGTPQTMTGLTQYSNIHKEILEYFAAKIQTLREMNIPDVVIDPGFGFAKTVAQNFDLLRQMEVFKALEAPILVGLSRKSMVWRTLGITAEDALNGTTALHSVALLKGASILRVHDVKEALQVVKLFAAMSPPISPP